MTTLLNQTTRPLSLGKIILFIMACIIIFIAAAIVCDLLTSWITPKLLKVVIREVLLRIPLTIYSLHLFAGRFIKAYQADSVYGKLTMFNTGKWIVFGFVLPVAAWVCYYIFHIITPYQHTRPIGFENNLELIIKWTAVSVAAGLTEEVLFRGHLFIILQRRFSVSKSIFISSLIFGLVHIAMLTSFTAGDIIIVIIGGTIAGTMFCWICLYTKAIWYAAIVHILWDVFFIGKITAVAIDQADANNTMMAFKLATQNPLFTGGKFGVEAGLPCLVLYIAATVTLFYLSRKNRLLYITPGYSR